MKLNIDKLHKAGALKEGAHTPCPGPVGSGRENDAVVCGLGELVWAGGGRACEFEWMPLPLCRNPPASWGQRSYSRPRFLCPRCQAGAYHLHLTANGFCCRRRAEVRYVSRAEQDEGSKQRRRLARARARLGMAADWLAEPPPPPRAPRSRWAWRRKVAALRAAELRVLGLGIEDLLRATS